MGDGRVTYKSGGKMRERMGGVEKDSYWRAGQARRLKERMGEEKSMIGKGFKA